MGMLAAGAYLKTLREQRKMSVQDVADRVTALVRAVGGDHEEPVSASTIWRIEEGKGKKSPSSYRLMAFAHVVGANLDELARRMFNVDAESWPTREDVIAELTPDDATPEEQARLDRLIDLLAEGMPPDEAARRVMRGQ